jgi:hypothetical protein
VSTNDLLEDLGIAFDIIHYFQVVLLFLAAVGAGGVVHIEEVS